MVENTTELMMDKGRIHRCYFERDVDCDDFE